jgi:hypothetical protein
MSLIKFLESPFPALRFLIIAVLCAGAMPCKAKPVLWGGAGADPTAGLLDATLIPVSTGTSPVRYTNVNGEGYDIVVTTSNLAADGPDTYMGEAAWWLEGTAMTSSTYSIVTFRFYSTGTKTAIGVTGVDIVFQDAESDELFGGFSYFDQSGAQLPLLFDDASFAYSYGGDFFLNYVEGSNAALEQGGTQTGKSIEIDMSTMTISGFTFGAHRQSKAAGSVIMMGLGDLSVSP